MAFDRSRKLRDREAESKGAWMTYDESTKFLIARRNNPQYKNFISMKFRENEKVITSKSNVSHANELSERFMLEGLAKFIVKDWKGVLDNKVEIPYSWEVALEMLEEHDDLKDMIEEFADSRDNFIRQQDADDVQVLKEL